MENCNHNIGSKNWQDIACNSLKTFVERSHRLNTFSPVRPDSIPQFCTSICFPSSRVDKHLLLYCSSIPYWRCSADYYHRIAWLSTVFDSRPLMKWQNCSSLIRFSENQIANINIWPAENSRRIDCAKTKKIVLSADLYPPVSRPQASCHSHSSAGFRCRRLADFTADLLGIVYICTAFGA